MGAPAKAAQSDRRLPVGLPATLALAGPGGRGDVKTLERHLKERRGEWIDALMDGRAELNDAVERVGFQVLAGPAREAVLAGSRPVRSEEAAIQARLKRIAAILAKMRRFGESPAEILDIWGYRVIVPDQAALGVLVTHIRDALWEAPTPADLVLRGGELRFPALRDYRRQEHAGLSASTSPRYDEAVHLNRRAPFGVVEIQVMTEDLFRRALVAADTEEGRRSFVRRRMAALRRP